MEKHLHRIWLHFVHRFVPFSLNRCVSENSPFHMQMTQIIGLAAVGTLIKKTSIYRVIFLTGTPLKVLSVRLHTSKSSEFTYQKKTCDF